MRKLGQIATWNSSKGYGFIKPKGGGKNVFLHITALRDRTTKPDIGLQVTYTEIFDGAEKIRADSVTAKAHRLRISSIQKAVITAIIFFSCLAGVISKGWLPLLFLWTYIVMSFLTFLIYGWDKLAARKSWQRTPENTLHMLGLLGGWPGASCAQQLFRHKSAKQPFRTMFWATVALNILGLIYLTSAGQDVAFSIDTILRERLED